MKTSDILTADLLDILFEGRNKTYGAYELRKTYDRRILVGLAGTFSVCLLFIVGSLLANSNRHKMTEEVATTVELSDFKDKEKQPEPPKPIPQKEQPKVEMAKVTPPLIVPDEQVTAKDEVKDINQLDNTQIGTIDQQGIKEEGMTAPPAEKDMGVVAAPIKRSDIDDIVVFVEKQARYPGGVAEWTKFLQRNLNKDIPADNGAPPADYTVIVSFIVDRFGNVSDVKAENDPGYGTRDEAIRVIRKGPKWEPAEQNGHAVVFRQCQAITFRITSD